MAEKIVLLDVTSERAGSRMRGLLPPGFVLDYVQGPGFPGAEELITDADYAIVGQRDVTATLLGAARRLKLLQKWGVGVDNLDLEAARACNVRVARTAGINAGPVAEFALGLIIAACRCVAFGHAQLKQGRWAGGGQLPYPTMTISGRTVGIIGFGAIGRRLAALLSSFGCEVLYTQRNRIPPADEADLAARYATLDELLEKSDIVSINCSLNDSTRGMIGWPALQRMKSSAVLVNVARGGVVVEADLIRALQRGVIAAAACDVFEQEPILPGNPLLSFDNLVVTPHIAASASDNFEPSVRRMFDNIAKVSRGDPLPSDDVVV